MKIDKELDCVGFLCPMPVVKTKLLLEEMNEGEIALILADDPGSKNDFPAWCRETGNELIKTEENGGIFKFYIKKAQNK